MESQENKKNCVDDIFKLIILIPIGIGVVSLLFVGLFYGVTYLYGLLQNYMVTAILMDVVNSALPQYEFLPFMARELYVLIISLFVILLVFSTSVFVASKLLNIVRCKKDWERARINTKILIKDLNMYKLGNIIVMRKGKSYYRDSNKLGKKKSKEVVLWLDEAHNLMSNWKRIWKCHKI